MTLASPWYLYPVTKQFNGGTEKGVDLGTPYHTPVTPLFPGVVSAVNTGPYGQEVDVRGLLNGQPVTASYVHLDQALVGVGQPVTQASELGVSGGQLAGGAHPASPAYSTGPHIEFSLWPSGTTPYAGTPYNPMSFIQAVQGNQGANVLGALGASGGATDSTLASLQSILGGLSGNLGNLGNLSGVGQGSPIINIQPPDIAGGVTSAASQIGRNTLAALHVGSFSDLLWRAALLVVALVLIIVIAQALSAKATEGVTADIISSPPVQATAKAIK
jgi:hypothetical protein